MANRKIKWMGSPTDAEMFGNSGIEIGRADDGKVWVRRTTTGDSMTADSNMMRLINEGDLEGAVKLFDQTLSPVDYSAEENALRGMIDDIEPPKHIDDIINDEFEKKGSVQWFERDPDDNEKSVTAIDSFKGGSGSNPGKFINRDIERQRNDRNEKRLVPAFDDEDELVRTYGRLNAGSHINDPIGSSSRVMGVPVGKTNDQKLREQLRYRNLRDAKRDLDNYDSDGVDPEESLRLGTAFSHKNARKFFDDDIGDIDEDLLEKYPNLLHLLKVK